MRINFGVENREGGSNEWVAPSLEPWSRVAVFGFATGMKVGSIWLLLRSYLKAQSLARLEWLFKGDLQ